MAFIVRVIGGADEGKTFRLEPGENSIGRAPNCKIVLRDDSVAWEHAALSDDQGKLHLTNQSALGTRLRGRRVEDRVRVRGKDEVQLSDSCRLLIEERAGKGAARRSNLVQGLVIAGVIVVLVCGAVFAILSPSGGKAFNPTSKHWNDSYHKLQARLESWNRRGWFPPEGVTLFRDGWRLELARSPAAALERWNAMRSLLMTATLPSARIEGQTMKQMAGPTHKSLLAVMGILESGAGSLQYRSDETFADALVWFTRYRAESCQNQVQKEQGS